MSQMKVTTINVLGGQKLEVLRNVAAHNLKRIVRVSFTIGRRQISPSMPYYSSSTSSTVPFASLTSSPTAWNSQFPNNWSKTSLWVLVGSFFACGKFEYFRSRCPDVISLFLIYWLARFSLQSADARSPLPCHTIHQVLVLLFLWRHWLRPQLPGVPCIRVIGLVRYVGDLASPVGRLDIFVVTPPIWSAIFVHLSTRLQNKHLWWTGNTLDPS